MNEGLVYTHAQNETALRVFFASSLKILDPGSGRICHGKMKWYGTAYDMVIDNVVLGMG